MRTTTILHHVPPSFFYSFQQSTTPVAAASFLPLLLVAPDTSPRVGWYPTCSAVHEMTAIPLSQAAAP